VIGKGCPEPLANKSPSMLPRGEAFWRGSKVRPLERHIILPNRVGVFDDKRGYLINSFIRKFKLVMMLVHYWNFCGSTLIDNSSITVKWDRLLMDTTIRTNSSKDLTFRSLDNLVTETRVNIIPDEDTPLLASTPTVPNA
jgi:hypothetical protein